MIYLHKLSWNINCWAGDTTQWYRACPTDLRPWIQSKAMVRESTTQFFARIISNQKFAVWTRAPISIQSLPIKVGMWNKTIYSIVSVDLLNMAISIVTLIDVHIFSWSFNILGGANSRTTKILRCSTLLHKMTYLYTTYAHLPLILSNITVVMLQCSEHKDKKKVCTCSVQTLCPRGKSMVSSNPGCLKLI